MVRYFFSFDFGIYVCKPLTISSFSHTAEDDGDEVNYSKETCEDLTKHLMHVKNIPQQCMKFRDIVHSVESNEKDRTHPTSWLS